MAGFAISQYDGKSAERVSMELEELSCRTLDLAGVTTLVDWAGEEGWNPGLQDAALFYQADPDGFVGFYLQDNLIAGGSIVSYGGEFGFMGLLIVKPEFRSQGIGRKLWYQRRDQLLARLKPGAGIGMDGVVDMQPFYNQGGFEIAFRDERYERRGIEFSVSADITPVNSADFSDLLDLDRECFGFERSDFLRAWINQPGSKSFKYSDEQGFQGFVLMRKTRRGYKIGPLFAENSAVAESLYQACLNAAIGEPVFLDIPVSNPGAVELVRKYQAEYVFECARMYYGTPPVVPIEKVFGITTFELG